MADEASGPSEILADTGLVYSELKELQPVLCKPKLLPIKSYSLERLERLEKKIALEAKQRRDAEKAEKAIAAWNTAPTAQQKLPQQSGQPMGGEEAKAAPKLTSASQGLSMPTPETARVAARSQERDLD